MKDVIIDIIIGAGVGLVVGLVFAWIDLAQPPREVTIDRGCTPAPAPAARLIPVRATIVYTVCTADGLLCAERAAPDGAPFPLRPGEHIQKVEAICEAQRHESGWCGECTPETKPATRHDGAKEE